MIEKKLEKNLTESKKDIFDFVKNDTQRNSDCFGELKELQAIHDGFINNYNYYDRLSW